MSDIDMDAIRREEKIADLRRRWIEADDRANSLQRQADTMHAEAYSLEAESDDAFTEAEDLYDELQELLDG